MSIIIGQARVLEKSRTWGSLSTNDATETKLVQWRWAASNRTWLRHVGPSELP